jgi:hypothetical protein
MLITIINGQFSWIYARWVFRLRMDPENVVKIRPTRFKPTHATCPGGVWLHGVESNWTGSEKSRAWIRLPHD